MPRAASWLPRPRVLLAGLSLSLVLAIATPHAAGRTGRVAASQPSPAVLTLVDADGEIWALPEGGDAVALGRGAEGAERVTGQAWHPAAPEVMVVRQRSDAFGHPLDRLVRVDLVTGMEQELLAMTGAQPRIARPRYGPDGGWAYVGVGCCLGESFVVFEGGVRRELPAEQFLGPIEVPTGSFVNAMVGPVAPDGRILMAVDWFFPGPNLPDVDGMYLVDRDLIRHERLSRGAPLVPIGLGPDGTWVVGFRCERDASDCSVNLVELPSGAERTLVSSGEPPLAYAGQAAPDGTIALATRGLATPEHGSYAVFGDLWLLDPVSGARRNVTNGAFPDFTAFAWAPSEVPHQLDTGRPTRSPRVVVESPIQLPRR